MCVVGVCDCDCGVEEEDEEWEDGWEAGLLPGWLGFEDGLWREGFRRTGIDAWLAIWMVRKYIYMYGFKTRFLTRLRKEERRLGLGRGLYNEQR